MQCRYAARSGPTFLLRRTNNARVFRSLPLAALSSVALYLSCRSFPTCLGADGVTSPLRFTDTPLRVTDRMPLPPQTNTRGRKCFSVGLRQRYFFSRSLCSGSRWTLSGRLSADTIGRQTLQRSNPPPALVNGKLWEGRTGAISLRNLCAFSVSLITRRHAACWMVLCPQLLASSFHAKKREYTRKISVREPVGRGHHDATLMRPLVFLPSTVST